MDQNQLNKMANAIEQKVSETADQFAEVRSNEAEARVTCLTLTMQKLLESGEFTNLSSDSIPGLQEICNDYVESYLTSASKSMDEDTYALVMRSAAGQVANACADSVVQRLVTMKRNKASRNTTPHFLSNNLYS
jgi:two-component sensor histidine kinase